MTLIIGKRSNLSKKLNKSIKNSALISSLEIENDVDMLIKYSLESSINIIFNNFQSSKLLNNSRDMEKYITKSILNTSKILDFFIKHNIKINKIIYTSSSSVYGNNKFCSEEDQVKPMNLQGSLKVANEELIKRVCEAHEINYTIVRIFNMYAGDDNFSIISKIKNSYLNNKILNVINNGKAVRDYIHIDDVVNIYKLLIDKKEELPKKLNIANGKGMRIIDLLSHLRKEGIIIKTDNIERDEINASIADVALLNEFLDVEGFIDVEKYLFDELNK